MKQPKASNKLAKLFREVITNEAIMRGNGIPPECSIFNDVDEAANLTALISEFAQSTTVPRAYNGRYGLDDHSVALESVAAHTNLVQAFANLVLTYIYGYDFTKTDDGFTYREIMEALRIHDLPENVFGDKCDNGAIDEKKKRRQEANYLNKFFNLYPQTCQPDARNTFIEHSQSLFKEMRPDGCPTGQLLYLIDKASAILITLWLDQIQYSPMIHESAEDLSERDREEMSLCDWRENGYCRASEMWTVDAFHIRKFMDADYTGIITAVIVMTTLQTNGKWYDWRWRDYEEAGIKINHV